MTKTTPSILFMITILMTTGVVASVDVIQDAFAIKSQGTKNPVTGSKKVCGDRLCSETEETPEPKKEVKPTPPPKTEPTPPPKVEPKTTPPPKTETQTQQKMDSAAHGWKYSSGTLTSTQDPGIGHETHQLAIILPPSKNVYKGILSYDASEPIQLISLHGPLAKGEDNGQAIWTPDGKAKFALTLVNPEASSGSWIFTGNALAVHTIHSDTFTVSYSLSYMEKETSETSKTGTIESVQDPGIGHETHQLAIILPPSENTYGGLLTYSASEPIQLVALHGPLKEGEDNGQAIWTPDGKTKFALTLVDNKDAMGTWAFAGNALAVHTLNQEPFTVSYSVVAGQ
jgi:hypothetical protein